LGVRFSGRSIYKGEIIMKRLKRIGLIFVLAFMTFSFTAVEAQTARFKTWKITVSQSGGFAGIRKSYTLDQKGNLNRVDKTQQNFELIDREKVLEIGKLIKELNLPRTKLKTVKGDKIYDGIYAGLIITLDGKNYHVEGNSFDDAEYLALSAEQRATLEKLKAKLNELNGFLPASMNN
jgi:hypothetical protein